MDRSLVTTVVGLLFPVLAASCTRSGSSSTMRDVPSPDVSASSPASPKATASGIVSILQTDTVASPVADVASDPSWTNAVVSGASVRSQWDKVEAAEGQYDWSYVDAAVSQAQQNQKFVGLTIWGGLHTPSWVYAGGATQFPFTQITNFQDPTSQVMPLPWDQAYLGPWKAFVTALGQRYDGSALRLETPCGQKLSDHNTQPSLRKK